MPTPERPESQGRMEHEGQKVRDEEKETRDEVGPDEVGPDEVAPDEQGEQPRGEGDAEGVWRQARIVSSCVTLMAAAYFLLVAFDNLTNLDSNWGFVKGVLAGDGLSKGNGFEWRAVHATWFAALSYAAIIAAETLAGVLLLHGGVRGLMWRSRPAAWERAQRSVMAGGLVGLLVFFFGFTVIGGNWFVMYLNDKWNGMDPAFQNTVTVLFVLVLSLATSAGGRLARSVSVPGPPG